MSRNCSELHSASVLRIRFLMKCLAMLPIKNILVSKVFCHIVLFTDVICFIWWYSIFYNKNIKNNLADDFSKFFEIAHCASILATHVVVVLELLWKSDSHEIEEHLEEIIIHLNQFLAQLVNLKRIRRYCNIVYIFWLLCCLTYLTMTFGGNRDIRFYVMYSNIVTTMRLTEFSLYCSVVLALHVELVEVASNIVNELKQTRFEALSIRRLSLEKLKQFQKIHGLLWASIRSVESNFQLSLITIIWRTFVHTFGMPYWIYFNIIWQNSAFSVLC